MKATYEELETELTQIRAELTQTRKDLQGLQILFKQSLDEIASLKEKLNLNSNNSSKPPSTDQKSNTSPKERKKRKPRKGIARSVFPPERIDQHIECTQKNCPHCGSSDLKLSNLSPEVLQQIELPEIRAIVTEYLLLKYNCTGCKKQSTAALPEGVPYSSFGVKVMALMTTLTGVFHLAKREAIQLIKDLYDIDVGLGSVSNIEERVANALDPACQRIHDFIIGSEFCKHFDETTWRNSGKRQYVWLAACEHAAYYMIDPSRSAKAFARLVGQDPRNLPSVTDRYAVYNVITNIHQYCLAHLIREFRKYAERDGPDAEIGDALEKELIRACKIHKKYCQGKIPWENRNKRLGHRKRMVKFWLNHGIANGSEKLYRLCENLLNKFEHLWTFMKIKGMEPTNNLAERDMRKLVIWRKKSYGTRSNRGIAFVERITTVAQSARRQCKNVFLFLQDAITSFYSSKNSPYIQPSMGF